MEIVGVSLTQLLPYSIEFTAENLVFLLEAPRKLSL
jgi:hypothetical protein